MAKQGTIVITGGCGFLGAAVATKLLDRDPDQKIVLTDIVENQRLDALKGKVTFVKADLISADECEKLITDDVSGVFHFASLVSGGAEQDFVAGMQANLYAPLNLLEACRKRGKCPKFIFPSTQATFGGAKLPSEVEDYTHQHPQNSYGVQKVITEQLLNDYSRKGYLDARAARLAAIIVRDVPNTAASGYASSIIREPLAGNDYICPVPADTRMPVLSIKKCVELMVGLFDLEKGSLGDYRAINGLSISPSAEEMAQAVRNSGLDNLGEIRFEPEPEIVEMIKAWPKVMHADRAKALGFKPDESIEAIVKDYIQQKSA